jgi:hypothetical protein
MAKPNPFAGKKAPPFGKGGGGGKPNPFAKKGAAADEGAGMPFKKGGKVKRK